MAHNQRAYFIISILLFILGLLIFFFATGFVRNYIGDVIVVMFLYCLLSLIVAWKPATKTMSVFILAIAVEFLQIFLATTGSTTQDLFLGSSFDIFDTLAYGVGLTIITIYEISTYCR